MATYLIPVADKVSNTNDIIKVTANSLLHAEEKAITKICDNYDFEDDLPDNFEEFRQSLIDYDIILGELTDIEIF